MDLWSKILAIYPELKDDPMVVVKGDIGLQNLGDERGDYIAKWEHPTLPCPTQEQLDSV